MSEVPAERMWKGHENKAAAIFVKSAQAVCCMLYAGLRHRRSSNNGTRFDTSLYHNHLRDVEFIMCIQKSEVPRVGHIHGRPSLHVPRVIREFLQHSYDRVRFPM